MLFYFFSRVLCIVFTKINFTSFTRRYRTWTSSKPTIASRVLSAAFSLSKLFNAKESFEGEFSAIARQGSGSACRRWVAFLAHCTFFSRLCSMTTVRLREAVKLVILQCSVLDSRTAVRAQWLATPASGKDRYVRCSLLRSYWSIGLKIYSPEQR